MNISDLPDDLANAIVHRKLDSIFLISNREKNNVILNPGLNLPWYSTNRKVAEHVARQAGNGAFACTLGEALKMQMLKFKN